MSKSAFLKGTLFALLLQPQVFSQTDCDSRCQMLRETVKVYAQSTVSIFTFAEETTDTSNTVDFSERFLGLGSGFFYGDCAIITNAHVVGQAKEMGVVISGLRGGLRATVKAKDERLDIAILQLDKPTKCQPLKTAERDSFQIGTPVVSVGNPMGLGWSVTSGMISAVKRSLGSSNFHKYLQSDAVIFPGNSGGPLLTLSGKLLGVNTLATVNAGLGFAFPAYVLDRIFPELLKHARLRPRYLGIKARQFQNKEKLSIDDYFAGVTVDSVTEGSPASKAGFKQGDVITRIEDTDISTVNDLEMELYSHPVDSIVTVETWTAGKKVLRTLTITLK